MIQIEDVKVCTVFSIEFINITFTIFDTSEDLTEYIFDLFRSDSSNGIFELVYSNITDFECNDYSANMLNPEIRYYYKIRVTNVITGETEFSNIFEPASAIEDNYAYYLSHVYNVYLDDVINGRDIYLLKKKRTGVRCKCYDDVRGSRNADRCTLCFGTGFDGGYYLPIKMKVNFLNAASKTEDMGPIGTFEGDSGFQFWTSNYPLIQESDVIVDGLTGERSVITSWQPSYKSGFLIRQTVQANKLPEAGLEYKIPI